MAGLLGDLASMATLILFLIYFLGRIITIFAVKQLWKDKVVINAEEYTNYDIIDEVPEDQWEEPIYRLLVSREGIRNLKVFGVKPDRDGIPCKKGDLIYERSFLNIEQAIAFHVMTGDLFPTLFIEYDGLDFTHVTIEWRDNLKNGVFSELVMPKHTIKSVLYYLCR